MWGLEGCKGLSDDRLNRIGVVYKPPITNAEIEVCYNIVEDLKEATAKVKPQSLKEPQNIISVSKKAKGAKTADEIAIEKKLKAETSKANALQRELDKKERTRLAKLEKETDKLAKIEADRLAKIEAEADRLAKIEADRLAKLEADKAKQISCEPFTIYNDCEECLVSNKEELLSFESNQVNKNIYTKILNRTFYKPYFKIEISHSVNESSKIIDKKNDAILSKSLGIIKEFLNIGEDTDIENLLILNKNKTNSKGVIDNIVYTYDIVVKGFKTFPCYIKDYFDMHLKEAKGKGFKQDFSFKTDIYKDGADGFKYPISIYDDFADLICYTGKNKWEYERVRWDKRVNTYTDAYLVKAKFDKKTNAVEEYDKPALLWLLKNINEVSKGLNYNKENERGQLDYDLGAVLKSILSNIGDGSGACSQDVCYVPNIGNQEGRKYATINSYQKIPRKIRHTLARNKYIDIDFANAHFAILLNLCKKFGFDESEYSQIKEYVNKREEYLADVMKGCKKERGDAKSLIISITYGADIDISKSVDWGAEFISQIECLSKKFAELPQFEKYVKSSQKEIEDDRIKPIKYANAKVAKAKVKKENLYGKTLSKILCEYENRCLECSLNYFKRNAIEYCGLAFDGCMLLKENEGNTELLRAVEADILEKEGIDIKVDYKKLDEGLDIPADYIHTPCEEYIINSKKKDTEACEIIVKLFGHSYLSCCGINYVKIDDVWKTGSSIVKDKILNDIQSVNIYIDKLDGVCYSNNTCYIEACLKLVLACGFRKDDEFLMEIGEASKYYIAYLNGIYSFRDRKLFPYSSLPNVPFLFKINRNYVRGTDDDIKQLLEILDKIFPMVEEREYFGKITARAIAGCVQDKFWIAGTGERNSGKGVLTDCFANSFGEFFGSFDSKHIMSHSKKGDFDMMFLIKVAGCRIFIANEKGDGIDEKGTETISKYRQEIVVKNTSFNGVMIKKITGGDIISGRMLHQQPISFKLQGIMFVNCNESIETSPADAMENCVVFDYKSQFLKADDPKLKIDCPMYKLADPDVKSILKEERMRNAFATWIFDSFEIDPTKIKMPESVSRATFEDVEDALPAPAVFIIENYEVSTDENDYYALEEIELVLKTFTTYKPRQVKNGIRTLFEDKVRRGKFDSNLKINHTMCDIRKKLWKNSDETRKRGITGIKYKGKCPHAYLQELKDKKENEGDE